MWSVPRCYWHYKSIIYLVVRQSTVNKGVNKETEGCMALAAVTRKRLVKIQQTEKTYYVL
jgi:hypothetical protein